MEKRREEWPPLALEVVMKLRKYCSWRDQVSAQLADQCAEEEFTVLHKSRDRQGRRRAEPSCPPK